MHTKKLQDKVYENIRQRREELKTAKGMDKELIEADLKKWNSIHDQLAFILTSTLYWLPGKPKIVQD